MEHLKRKKVLFFVNSHLAGAERMTINISEYLDPKSYNVVFYVVGKDFGLVEKVFPEGAVKRLIRVKSFKDFLFFRLINVLWTERPSIVFSSLMPINWRLCFASFFSPSKKVIIRANNYLYTQSLIQKIRLFFAYRFAHTIIVQTSEMMDEHIRVLKLSNRKVIDLANPVNTENINNKLQDAVSPYTAGNINYAFVGRIHRVKGLDILLRAFFEVVKVQSEAKLYLIGEYSGVFQSYYKDLLKLTDELGLAESVVFKGFTDNPYPYMKFADCFVLPSRNEGLPNVVIEALYVNTPVAVTVSIPVIRRIVAEGVNGFLADVEDIEGLAKAMLASANLGRVKTRYTSATKEDFLKLFS